MGLTLIIKFHVFNDQAQMRLVPGFPAFSMDYRACMCTVLKLLPILFCCRFYHDLYVFGFVFVELRTNEVVWVVVTRV